MENGGGRNRRHSGEKGLHKFKHRTILDIVKDDPSLAKESKKTWKAFRDKLRLKRAGSAWTSSVHIPTSDIPIQSSNANRLSMMRQRASTRYPNDLNPDDLGGGGDDDEDEGGEESSTATAPPPPQLSSRSILMRHNTSRMPEREGGRILARETEMSEEDDEDELLSAEEGEDGGAGDDGTAKMSLMSLLADDGSAYMEGEEEEEEPAEEEEEEDDDDEEDGGDYNICCGCSVKHKGAAMSPCGHTYCRLCSRDLYVQRGNCPHCNKFVLEILDIF